MYKVTLAKNTDHEFILELPFNSFNEFRLAKIEFKKKYFPNLVNKKVPCYEFYLQYLDKDKSYCTHYWCTSWQ